MTVSKRAGERIMMDDGNAWNPEEFDLEDTQLMVNLVFKKDSE